MGREGAIGELRTLAAFVPRRLVHIGTHVFDLFRLFAGDAAAVSARITGEPAEDPGSSVYLEFRSGAVGWMDARPRVAPAYLELLGTQGLLRLGNDIGATWERLRPCPSGGRHEAYYQPPLATEPLPPVAEPGERPVWGRNVTRQAVDEVVACARGSREPDLQAFRTHDGLAPGVVYGDPVSMRILRARSTS